MQAVRSVSLECPMPGSISKVGLTVLLAFLAPPVISNGPLPPVAAEENVHSALVREALRHMGCPRGVCVVVGDARLALALARGSEALVYLQLAEADAVEAVRREASEAGLYGERLFVERGDRARLHLADDLADVVLAVGEGLPTPWEEALRVLRPGGRAWVGDESRTKPRPLGADDWSHPYHGPDNNPASTDQFARAPYLTRFLADPRYAPLPQVAVASAGRVFKLFGHIAFKEREEPWLDTMAAFNGYNGSFLWRREITPGLMVHRSTIVATPSLVYFADERSCKVIDAATGRLVDEIAPPAAEAGGSFWKWMALVDGVLYAMIGEDEKRDPVIKLKSENHGWPWDPLSPGFNQGENPWGFGRDLLAIDPETKRILWRRHEDEAFDSRATCMKDGRIFLFRHGSWLSCVDAPSGKELWRKTKADAPDIFGAIGPDLNRQDWRTNWRTAAYAKAGVGAIYFAGPMISGLVAVSSADGRLLWSHPYSNYQIVLQGGAVWGLSGQIDQEVSRKFEPLTGRVLEEIALGRRACTRPTGAIDAIFCRASGGSTRLDLASPKPQLVSPMRAQCQDGVTIANGLLYWWPSVCDCNLTLYGITCLGPAGAHEFDRPAVESERLERAENSIPSSSVSPASPPSPSPLPPPSPQDSRQDWPLFRADASATAVTRASLSTKGLQAWSAPPSSQGTPTAPTAAMGLVFLADSSGAVRALDAATGRGVWTAFTGGALRFPPAIWKDRAFVGSADGWVYSFEARTGRLLWRFRVAPSERWIPVYGRLHSTWPATSGILAHEGVVYAAAGIVNYDGTHLVALDAETGTIRWQNNVSGHLDRDSLSGVSVQGHMIIHSGALFLAGGNAVSPAIYELASGRCLNDPAMVHKLANNNVPSAESPRGAELYAIGDHVMVGGQPFYAHPRYKVYDASVLQKTWVGSAGERDVLWVNEARVLAFARGGAERADQYARAWGKPRVQGLEPVWTRDVKESRAVALAANALVIAARDRVLALDLDRGRELWSRALPAPPVNWGLAIDRDGRAIVVLEDGRVLCFAEP